MSLDRKNVEKINKKGSPKLSVVIITFNEEKNIRQCLESVKGMDEIIVVDSFSNDKTVEICREYTGKVIQQKWLGYVAQKQFALEQACGEWIMLLDADERISPEASVEIKSKILLGSPSVNGFIFPRHSFYLGRWINHGGWYPDYKLRLVRKGFARWGGEDPHDKLILNGKAEFLQGEILHYVYTEISHQLKTVNSFSQITVEQWNKKGKKSNLFQLFFRPPIKFFETYFYKRGFLDGMPGFLIAVITSFYVFFKFAKLWELNNNGKK